MLRKLRESVEHAQNIGQAALVDALQQRQVLARQENKIKKIEERLLSPKNKERRDG